MNRKTMIDFSIKHPWRVILICSLMFLALGKGLGKLTFSNDYRDYFSQENPQLIEWERLQKVFNKSDNVFIVVTSKEGNIFTKGNLRVLAELTESGKTIPYSTRVDSIVNFQHVEPIGEDEIEVRDLLQIGQDISNNDIEKIKSISTHHLSLVNRLISRNGATAGINVEVNLSEKPREQISEISKRAYEIKKEFSEKYSNLSFHITGSVPYNFAMTDATKKDMGSLMPLMYLIILVLFGLITRSVLASVSVFVLIVVSIISTMGASAWGGVVLMAPSMSAPTIVMTLAVSNAVHLVLSFFRYYQGDVPKEDAIKKMLSTNWSPIWITNITTAVGFLTMNFSDVPPYRDLGNMVAVGLLLVVCLSLVLLPALLRILPLRPKKVKTDRKSYFSIISGLIIKRHYSIAALFAFILLPAGYGIMQLELNDRFIEWMDTRYEFRNDSDHVNKELTGLYRLDWGLESGSERGIFTPEYLTVLSDLADWAREQPGVVHVSSLSDTIKELNQKFHSGDQNYYRIPKDSYLAAQLFLIYELSLPMGMDLNNRVNISRSSTRFVLRTANLSTVELLDLEKRTKNWLKENALPSMVGEAASTTILFANISKRNISSLLTGTIIALFLISVMLIAPFKSLRLGLLSLIPNLLPAAIGFGVWGLLVGQVGLAISIVVGMTMGILVDDTVHFMTWYLRNRRGKGKTAAEAVRATFEQVGPALSGTTLLLITGFSILAYSGFEVNSQMGALTALVIGLAYLTDILLLPSLLIIFDRKPALEMAEKANDVPGQEPVGEQT